ncbi:MAG: protein-glutamate O-methyltransferase CheR [Gemmataceae bacterium]|nr:protein-glutamate O-methyltransferase CheR [Gemmataceae bacterium]
MGTRFDGISLPPSVFAILRDLIRERLGLQYEDEKRELLADKLSSRVQERGFESFLDYYYLLKYGPGAEDEWFQVMDALSVPETFFWREMEAVRALVDVIVAQHFAVSRAMPLRIWCAACASGEEPLSIVMALNEAGWLDRVPIEIRASDGSSAALARARQGVYRERAFRNLPVSLRRKYFTEESDGKWRVVATIHRQVTWERANLLAEDEVASLARASVIFCRNVFIYFSAAAIARTVARFAASMAIPGHLFIGVSESLVRLTTDFELQEIGGAFVYVKR